MGGYCSNGDSSRLRLRPDGHGAEQQISTATERRYRRRLLRDEGRGPVPMDGRSQLTGVEQVDWRRESHDVQASRRAAGARRAEEADHRAVQLPARDRAAVRGTALVLQ